MISRTFASVFPRQLPPPGWQESSLILSSIDAEADTAGTALFICTVPTLAPILAALRVTCSLGVHPVDSQDGLYLSPVSPAMCQNLCPNIRRNVRVLIALIAASGTMGAQQSPTPFHLQEASIADIQRALIAKKITSVGLVQLYLKRIKTYNNT